MVVGANPSLVLPPAYPIDKYSRRLYRSPCNHFCPVSFQFNRVSGSNASEATSTIRERKRRCECYDLYKELVPYGDAWSWQKSIVKQRKALVEMNRDCSDTLIMLQHHPVYTLGTRSSEEYLNFNFNDAPYDVYRTERGGEVTYHGPGQLVMYPIINLRFHKMDLHWYLRALEEVVIRVLSSTFSLKASRIEGLTGVWVGEFQVFAYFVDGLAHPTFALWTYRREGDQKLAAIGIRVSQWIAYHGLALNVSNDLTPFQRIVPCGIRDRGVGSTKALLKEHLSSNQVYDCKLIDITHESLLKEFSEVFQLELLHKPISQLEFSMGEPSEMVS